MKRSFLLCLMLLLSAAVLWAQKPALDHSVYDGWKSVSRPVIQEGSEWASYAINPQEGDGVLYLYNVKTGKSFSADRASRAMISADGTKAVYRITPRFQVLPINEVRTMLFSRVSIRRLPPRFYSKVDRASSLLRLIGLSKMRFEKEWLSLLLSTVFLHSLRKDNEI